MSVLNPDHLVDQARRLIAPQAGRPVQVDIRRAISSSYYAVFHAVVTAVADHYVGKRHRGAMRYALAYRSLDHRRLKKVCRDLSLTSLPKDYAIQLPKPGLGRDLVAFAAATADLQERRLSADYDPSKAFIAADALAAIAAAETALRNFDRLESDVKVLFLNLLVFLPRNP